MTIEEAKKIIEQFRDRQGNSKDDVEAYDIAIKSLEDKGYKQGYADGFADCLELNT